MTELPRFLTVDEWAALRRKTPEAVYCERYRGEGPPAIRDGRRLIFDREKALAWLASHEEVRAT